MEAHSTDPTTPTPTPFTPTPTPTPAPGRLFRSRDDRLVGGVCGGLGRYLGIDPVILRLVVVVLVLFAGTGILAYIIAWIVIPEEPASVAPSGGEVADGADARGAPGQATASRTSVPRGGATALGVVLIGVGVLLLADRLIPGLSWRFTGPIVLVAIGVLVLLKGASR